MTFVLLRRRWNSFWRWTSRQWTWPPTSAVWCLQDHLFSHFGSLTVGKLVDRIQLCSMWYCDHKQLFEITQIQLSIVRFQILAKSLPGLPVPSETLARLICPLRSCLHVCLNNKHNNSGMFCNEKYSYLELKKRRKIVLRITHQGVVKYLQYLQYCIWQLPNTQCHVNTKKLFVVAL